MTDFNQIHAFSLSEPTFEPKFMGDVLSFEGPILSHYIDRKQKNYLMYFLGHDQSFSVWVMFDIGATNFLKYLDKELTLLEIFKLNQNTDCYLVWCDGNGKHKKYKITKMGELPTAVLPGKKSYFSTALSNGYTEQLKEKLRKAIEVKSKVNKRIFHFSNRMDDVYRNPQSDQHVLNIRIISKLLQPLIQFEGKKGFYDAETKQLISLGFYIDQDPFGNTYFDLLHKVADLFQLNIKGKSPNDQFNDVLFQITKELISKLQKTRSQERKRTLGLTYSSFVIFIQSNNLVLKYFEGSKIPEVKSFLEQLEIE